MKAHIETRKPNSQSQNHATERRSQRREDKGRSLRQDGHGKEKEVYTRDWGRMSHHDTSMRVERGVSAGQQKTQAKEGKTLGNSFEATSHAPVNANKKSKKNGKPLTAQVAGRTLRPKSYITQKMIVIGAYNNP
ncbi:hypothetical protein Tco_0924838 [Tanacetum coccineum]|uniref:Uncharacterized protein n=1 Tax=Tanacetum coccineum TaxID=301880 RepID=A0ABQ5DC45_9ASTR